MSNTQKFGQDYDPVTGKPTDNEICDPNAIQEEDRFKVTTHPTIDVPNSNSRDIPNADSDSEIYEINNGDGNRLRVGTWDRDAHGTIEGHLLEREGKIATNSGDLKWATDVLGGRPPSLNDGFDIGTQRLARAKAGFRTNEGEECFVEVDIKLDIQGKNKASKRFKEANDFLKEKTKGVKRLQANDEEEVTIGVGVKKIGAQYSSTKNPSNEMVKKVRIEYGIGRVALGCNDKAIDKAIGNTKRDFQEGAEKSKEWWDFLSRSDGEGVQYLMDWMSEI